MTSLMAISKIFINLDQKIVGVIIKEVRKMVYLKNIGKMENYELRCSSKMTQKMELPLSTTKMVL